MQEAQVIAAYQVLPVLGAGENRRRYLAARGAASQLLIEARAGARIDGSSESVLEEGGEEAVVRAAATVLEIFRRAGQGDRHLLVRAAAAQGLAQVAEHRQT